MTINKRSIGNCSFAILSALLLTQVPAALAQENTTNNTVTTEVTTSETAVEPTALAPVAAPTLNAAPAALPAPTADKDIVILHTNDIHGRMQEEKAKDGTTTVLGMPKLDALVEKERAKDQVTVLLDAGDAFQGLPISNISKGEEMAKLMNEVGYDAMAVGNHEFDFSLDQLKKLKGMLAFPLLSSNTYVNDARLFDASTIIDKDTNMIGDELVVIGVTTPETATKTHPNNIQGVTFKDPLTEVLNVIREIEGKATAEGKKYNNYVILGHLGIDASTPDAWRGDKLMEALAKDSSLANKNLVFIDGHSHSVQTNKVSDNLVYQQTGTNLNNVGKITLKTNDTIEAELIKAADAGKLTASPDIEKQVEGIKADFMAATSGVVAENNPVDFNGERSNVRVRQTNLGDAIADAMYNYSLTGFNQPSDLAVTNGGGIRASIEKGKPITAYDIISVLPFGNIISQIEVTGEQIQAMFEHSLSAENDVDDKGNPRYDENFGMEVPLLAPNGSFLQISGAKVHYDAKAKPGERKITVEIYDRATKSYKLLDPNRTYRLTTNDFLAVGGDGYTMLGGNRSEGPSLDTVFGSYLKTHSNILEYAEVNKYDRVIPFAYEAPAETSEEEPKDEETTGEEKSSDKDNNKKPGMTVVKAQEKTSDKKELPSTGEKDNLAIFNAAALSILIGLGLAIAPTKEEN